MIARLIDRSNLPALISAQIRDGVLDGELKPGAQLLGHRQLAQLFGVSVPTIREAISALTNAGVLEARHGAGTFVTRSPRLEQALSTWSEPAPDEAEMRHLVEARDVIERAVARFAALRATSAEARALRQAVADMTASLEEPDAYLAADLAFHQALATAAHNQVLLRAMLAVRSSLRREHSFNASHTATRLADLRHGTELHQRLADAVATGDTKRADRVMDDIIARASRYLG